MHTHSHAITYSHHGELCVLLLFPYPPSTVHPSPLTQIQDLGVALLMQLSNADGPLVDNVALIDVLQATKTASADIEAQHENGREAARLIESTRAAYAAVGVRGAVLFLTGTSLGRVMPSYQLSFGRFLHLFKQALQRTPLSRATEQRCENELALGG